MSLLAHRCQGDEVAQGLSPPLSSAGVPHNEGVPGSILTRPWFSGVLCLLV